MARLQRIGLITESCINAASLAILLAIITMLVVKQEVVAIPETIMCLMVLEELFTAYVMALVLMIGGGSNVIKDVWALLIGAPLLNPHPIRLAPQKPRPLIVVLASTPRHPVRAAPVRIARRKADIQ
jgi:hypothetical protein